MQRRRCGSRQWRKGPAHVFGGWAVLIVVTVFLCRLGSAVGALAVSPSSQRDFPTAPDYPDDGLLCRLMPDLRQSVYYGDWIVWGKVTGCGSEVSYTVRPGMKLWKAYPVYVTVLECIKGTNPGGRITVWIESTEREYLPEFRPGEEFMFFLRRFYPREGYQLCLGAEGIHYVSWDRRMYPVNPSIKLAPTAGIPVWEFRGMARRANVAKSNVAYEVWKWKLRELYPEMW